jgi:uncharacterized protein (TIGR02996 family)
VSDVVGTRLLTAILASPRDMELRQVYADHLLDRGDPRGELISLQLAGRDPARVAELVALHARDWVGPLAPWIDPAASRFEDGFLAEVTIVERRDFAAIVGDPIWATVRAIHLGSLRRLRAADLARLLRACSVLVAHPIMRSLVTVTADHEPLMIERDDEGLARFVPRFR